MVANHSRFYIACLYIVLVFDKGHSKLISSPNLTDIDAFPEGHPQRCVILLGRPINIFEVLPGSGWDNLANEEHGQTFDLQYKRCRVTEDGVYLIPDHVNVIPVKESNVGLFAEFTESMASYKSATSSSINGDVSGSIGLPAEGLGISGSFSAGHREARSHMTKKDSSTFISRVTARYNRYKVHIQPDTPLAPALKKRILEIAECYQLNDGALGRYLSEVLVRDFGTNVITSVDAGAVYMKEDFLTKDSGSSEDTASRGLKIGAGLAFSATFESEMGPIDVGLQFGIKTGSGDAAARLEAYQKQTSHSTVIAFGGPPVGFSKSNSTWIDSLNNNLVATDRHGQPIHDMITTTTLPELPASLVVDVQSTVKRAVAAYYSYNTYRGCTNRKANNFDIAANVGDTSCFSRENTSIFGGVYQTCSTSPANDVDACSQYAHVNPLTQDYSCPRRYKAVKLVSGHPTTTRLEYVCHGLWYWKQCSPSFTHVSIVYESYWCAFYNSTEVERKVYFGGIFTSTRVNEVTASMACPDDFQTVTLGDDIHVCFGSHPIQGYGFGGMFSCQHGNMMALKSYSHGSNNIPPRTSMPKSCPVNLSRRFLTLIEDCEVEFCSNLVEPITPRRPPVLQRPPFVKFPHPSKEHTSRLDLVLLSNEGEWFKNEKAYEQMSLLQDLSSKMDSYKELSHSLEIRSTAWFDLKPGQTSTSTEQPSILTRVTDPNTYVDADGFTTPVIATIASLVTALCIVTTTLFVAMYRRRIRRGEGRYKDIKSLPITQTERDDVQEEAESEISILIQPNSYGSSS